MATKRKPLPYAAEAIRGEAVAELHTLGEMIKQIGAAAAQGNTAMVIHVGFEAHEKTHNVIALLNEIPKARE